MYIPNSYREENLDTLVTFMQANNFATLVSILAGAPFATHIPIILSVAEGVVTLTGHIAKANPQLRTFGAGESLAIFTGPHAYVSPSLYENRESVPTWNYISVHAYGTPRAVTLDESREEIVRALEALIAQHDAAYMKQWQALSEKYREVMMSGIVAFEMRVTRLEGKYKLSQNRSEMDQKNVAHALMGSENPIVAEVGNEMAKISSRRDKSSARDCGRDDESGEVGSVQGAFDLFA